MRQIVLALCLTACAAEVRSEARVPPAMLYATSAIPRESPHLPAPARRKIFSPAELASRCGPSVVVVDTPKRLGAGFVVAPDRIATSLHVVFGQKTISVKTHDGKEHVVSAVEFVDRSNDLAVLTVPGISKLPLPLADAGDLRPGDSITAIGHPRGLQATVSTGVVAAIRSIGGGREVVQHTAPISSGSSGGPIINEYGEVVGVVRGVLASGQALNFASPSSSLERLLQGDAVGYSLDRFAEATGHGSFSSSGVVGEDTALPKERGKELGRLPFPNAVAGFTFGMASDRAAYRCADPIERHLANMGRPWQSRLEERDVWIRCPFAPSPLDFIAGEVLMKFPSGRLTAVIVETTRWDLAYERVREKYGVPDRMRKGEKWVPFTEPLEPTDLAWLLSGGRILLAAQQDQLLFVSDLEARYRLEGF